MGALAVRHKVGLRQTFTKMLPGHKRPWGKKSQQKFRWLFFKGLDLVVQTPEISLT